MSLSGRAGGLSIGIAASAALFVGLLSASCEDTDDQARWVLESGSVGAIAEAAAERADTDRGRWMDVHVWAFYQRAWLRYVGAGPRNAQAGAFVRSWLRWHADHRSDRVRVTIARADEHSLVAADEALAGETDNAAKAGAYFRDNKLDYPLARVLDARFEALFGDDVLDFAAYDRASDPRPTVSIAYTLEPTLDVLRIVGPSQRRLPGFTMLATLSLRVPGVDETIEVEGRTQPADDHSFETNAIAASISITYPDSTAMDDDAFAGMATSALEQLVDLLMAKLVMQPSAGSAEVEPRSVKLQRWCDALEYDACAELAGMYATGEGVELDQKRAAELLFDTCLLGRRPDACVALAWKHLRGDGVEHDVARASVLMEQGCMVQAAQCYELHGELRVHGPAVAEFLEGSDPPRMDGFALADFEKACGLGRSSACERLTTLLGGEAGEAVEPARAAELRATACEGGAVEACSPESPVDAPSPDDPEEEPKPRPR